MIRTTCAHFVPIEEECGQCNEKHTHSKIQILEQRLKAVQNMLNNRDNELSNAREEIADLTRRLATITNLYGSNI